MLFATDQRTGHYLTATGKAIETYKIGKTKSAAIIRFMRILFFGGSITQGFWDTDGGWVQRIRRNYDRQAIQNITDRYFATFFNLGISGDKSDSVLHRLQVEIEARARPDEEFVLVFAVGTNDAYVKNDQPYSSVEKFNENVEALIKIAKRYANKIMFIGVASCDESRTKPVFWDNVIWENNRLKEFDLALEKICQQHNINFLTIFEKFQQEQRKRNLLEDGIHPNNAGHQFIAELVQPNLEQLISH